MNVITTYLFSKIQQPREIKWFTNALYLFLLYKVFIYFFQFNELFSCNALVFNHTYISHSFKDVAFILTNNYSTLFACVLLLFIAIASLLGLLNKTHYVIKIMLWLTVLNLHNYLYPILTGGEFLLNQLLFFNIFFNQNLASKNDLKNAIHNIALIAIKTQVCLAYFVAALYKLQCAEWLNGSALSQVFNVNVFSNSVVVLIPSVLLICATFIVLAYQLLFPFLIWFKSLKIYLLGLGVLQHLFIAFAMGLTSFGFIMIICYILFLKYDYK